MGGKQLLSITAGYAIIGVLLLFFAAPLKASAAAYTSCGFTAPSTSWVTNAKNKLASARSFNGWTEPDVDWTLSTNPVMVVNATSDASSTGFPHPTGLQLIIGNAPTELHIAQDTNGQYVQLKRSAFPTIFYMIPMNTDGTAGSVSGVQRWYTTNNNGTTDTVEKITCADGYNNVTVDSSFTSTINHYFPDFTGTYPSFPKPPTPTCSNGASDYPTCTPPSTGSGTTTTPATTNTPMTKDEFHLIMHQYAVKGVSFAIALAVAYVCINALRWKPK